ncbi:MAG: hypothetical protein ACFFBD_03105 [Candidatus Hodarchaeota archaeon]
MSMESNFCQFCGFTLSSDDRYCSSCGNLVTGSRALKGPAEINLSGKNMILAISGIFIAINIAGIVFLILFPPPMTIGGIWLFFVPSLVILIALLSLLNIHFNEGGITTWIGKQLNPYKPPSLAERVGMLVGGFFMVIFAGFVLFLFLNPNVPLFTQKDLFIASLIFLPVIIDISFLAVQFVIGNAPEFQPFLAIRNVIMIIILSLVLIIWFLDIPGMILWVGNTFGIPFLSGLASLTFIEDIFKFGIWIGVIANFLGLLWHLILFTVWLDAKHGLLGGVIASVKS